VSDDRVKRTHDSIHDNLFKIYLDYGIDVLVKLAAETLHDFGLGEELQAQVNGEVCEVVLECLIVDYTLRNKEKCKDWLLYKGLILKERGHLSDSFSTELDLTLVTPQCIYLFECKSYKGNNTLTGKGVYKNTDVYKQNMLHLKTLDTLAKPFVVKGNLPVYKIALFVFSDGKVEDKRTVDARTLMPLLSLNNWESVLCKDDRVVWDMRNLAKLFDKLEKQSEKLYYEHLNYVKNKH